MGIISPPNANIISPPLVKDLTNTERTSSSMNPAVKSAAAALWSNMVEEDQNEPEQIIIFP